jgi:hypothetical protein
MAAKNDLVAWDMFRKCVTDTLGVEAAGDAAIYDHWFRFLEDMGKEKVQSLALAFDFENRATWRPLWEVMFEWCVGERSEQALEEKASKHRTVYAVGPDGKTRRVLIPRKPQK